MSPNSNTALFLQDIETRLKEHFPGTKVLTGFRSTSMNGLAVYALVDDVSAYVVLDIFDCMTEESCIENVANQLIDNIEKVLARRKNERSDRESNA